MPELPEVESTARYLHERIAGDTIAAVAVLWPRTVGDSDRFTAKLTGATITAVFRRAKFVCFSCIDAHAHPFTITTHLRMSGSFDVLKTSLAPQKHDRFIWRMESGKTVSFCDPRKFGRATIESDFDQFSQRWGIEPLSLEFTEAALAERLQRKRSLKPLLLDQSVIAGLGNIYVDEALWHAKLHPLMRADRVRPDGIRSLREAIQKVLRAAIRKQGTDFGDGVVEMGNYKPVAYGRTGKPCKRCSEPIVRLIVGQRSTHICHVCQQRVVRARRMT